MTRIAQCHPAQMLLTFLLVFFLTIGGCGPPGPDGYEIGIDLERVYQSLPEKAKSAARPLSKCDSREGDAYLAAKAFEIPIRVQDKSLLRDSLMRAATNEADRNEADYDSRVGGERGDRFRVHCTKGPRRGTISGTLTDVQRGPNGTLVVRVDLEYREWTIENEPPPGVASDYSDYEPRPTVNHPLMEDRRPRAGQQSIN